MKGVVKNKVEDRGFGFITSDEDGRHYFFHFSGLQHGLRFDELQPGDRVEFELVVGEKGPKAVGVRREVGPNDNYRFLNPYNFVRFLPAPSKPADDDPVPVQVAKTLLSRCPPPPHDRYVGLSGSITCRLKALSPLFVSDAHDVTKGEAGADPKHKSYRFFRLGDQFAIPGSSLRGMVRSIFEAVTGSCLMHVNDRQLDFRLAATRSKQLHAARVLAVPDPTAEREGVVELLEYAWVDREIIEEAAEGAFEPETPHRGILADLVKRHSWPDKPPYEKYFPFVMKNPGMPILARLGTRIKHGREYPAVDEFLRVEDANHGTPPPGADGFVWGYLKITGPTVVVEERGKPPRIRKHRERFFYQGKKRATATIPYRAEHPERQSVAERYAEVRKSQQEHQQLDYVTYLDHETLHVGDLVWVLLDNHGRVVTHVGSVSIPKLRYQHGILDLTPEHLRACGDQDALCPACRLFGWVHPDANEVRKSQSVAYRSRVRISHAKHVSSPLRKPQGPFHLAILGSPKPTCVHFYLRRVGDPNALSWDSRQVDDGYDSPRDGVRVAGRKMYRRHKQKDLQRLNQGKHEYEHVADEQIDQNRTVRDVLPEGNEFEFTVDFDNLSAIELGALLWSLTLEKDWAHRLGYAKPLGFGTVEVRVVELAVRDNVRRYASLRNGADEPSPPTKWIDEFKKALVTAYGETFQATISDLQALLGPPDEDDSRWIHYPRTREEPQAEGKNFEWFVRNRRGVPPGELGQNLGLLPPEEERQADGFPLRPTRPKQP